MKDFERAGNCRDAGGPEGYWKLNRDPSGQKRLDWVISMIGHLSIHDVTTTEMDKLVKNLAKRPAKSGPGKLSNGTINRYLTMLSAVLTFAGDRGIIRASPNVPWQEYAGQRIHWVSADQRDLLAGYMTKQGQLRTALTLHILCNTGIRWSEYEGLEPFMVEFTTAEDGTQDAWIKLDETKTDTPRDVPIDVGLGRDLKDLLVTDGPQDYRTFYMQMRSAVKACGLNPKLTPHTLRHGAATILTKKKVPTPIVQGFLGHKSINTTMKYIHVENEDIRDAAKFLSPQRGKVAEIAQKGDLLDFKKAL